MTRCSDMKFRQRCAWLAIVAYLLLTALAVYYVFEISEAFNAYALQHSTDFHSQNADPRAQTEAPALLARLRRLVGHAFDLPKPLVAALLALAYLHVFFTLIACTKQEPRLYLSYGSLWYVYTRLTRGAQPPSAPSASAASSSSSRGKNVSNNNSCKDVTLTLPS